MTARASPRRRNSSATVTAVITSQPSSTTPRATAAGGPGAGRTEANSGSAARVSTARAVGGSAAPR
jgi:hypothetical protein